MVPDARVVLSALVDDTGSGALAREGLARDEMHAPHLLDVEVTSALRGRVLGGHLDPLRAAAAPHDLDDLAEALEQPLVTANARLAQAPGLRCDLRLLRA